jgi:hypothetical protein
MINVRVGEVIENMEQKPIHYDGSFQLGQAVNESVLNEPFQMTDEMRVNIGRNPYSLDTNE